MARQKRKRQGIGWQGIVLEVSRCRRESGGSGDQGRGMDRGELSTNTSRGRKERNIFRKIKRNVRKFLSPASGDKSVHKFATPSKSRVFLHLQRRCLKIKH